MPHAAPEVESVVQQHQRAMNSSRYVPTMPDIIRKVSAENSVYIFNVGPWAHARELGSAGIYRIPACPEGQEYSVPVVIDGIVGEPYPMNEVACVTLPTCGDPRQLTGEGSGLALAKQIIGDGPFISKAASYVKFGVFISLTPKPTKDALAEANATLQRTHLALIREANAAYMKDPTNREGVIQSAWHFVSAHALMKTKAECPWLGDSLAPAGRDNCPGCGAVYNVGLEKCSCGRVLNKAKYDAAKKAGLYD